MPDPSRTDVVSPAGATAAAVLLHPHPSYGGDRHNIVVDALWRTLPPAGIAAVRFDFDGDDLQRGVDQTLAALDLLPPGIPTFVVGYSFGAVAASRVVDDRLVGWVLIAPPFGRLLPAAGAPAGADARPKLLLVPAHDQFCQPADVRREVAEWLAVTVEEIPTADHFLAGSTADAAERVVNWTGALAGR